MGVSQVGLQGVPHLPLQIYSSTLPNTTQQATLIGLQLGSTNRQHKETEKERGEWGQLISSAPSLCGRLTWLDPLTEGHSSIRDHQGSPRPSSGSAPCPCLFKPRVISAPHSKSPLLRAISIPWVHKNGHLFNSTQITHFWSVIHSLTGPYKKL